MDKIEFDDDDNLDSLKVREMTKELHEIKVKRLEKEKINTLGEEIHDEKIKLRNREIIDKIPKPVVRFAKGVGNVATRVASSVSKMEANNTKRYSPKISSKNKRQIRSIDRSSPSISSISSGLTNFTNSLGGVASSQPRRSNKPHNPFGMVNNFSSSLNRDLLNSQPPKPVTKRKKKAKTKGVRTKYIILR
jgi:hypothetical protein